MNFKALIPFSLLLFTFNLLNAQEKGEKTTYTFKDTRIINGQSVESNQEGQLKFLISHRFGSISGGIDEFFGLDQASIRLGLDYGIWDWLTIGIGRSSFEKTVDGFIKARVLHQRESNGSPLSITVLSSIATQTADFPEQDRENYFSSRLFYANQVMFARKFSDRFSLQLMPTLVHRNLVESTDVNNDVISIGAATRFQLTKTISLQTEYYYTLPDQLAEQFYNSLSIGVDIETKGHVFQLNFSNSQGMIEKFFIGETRGQWSEGDIYFGFNISRDFQLKGRKYK
ncbi:MAG: DUF5777 family beta-barrel protein [Vicingaceae bacterium]